MYGDIMQNWRQIVRNALEYVLELIDNTEEKKPQNDWSVYIINTTDSYVIMAAREDFDAIPDDGSFIGGVVICTGMTEESAHRRAKLLSETLRGSEKDTEKKDGRYIG